ncbi:MAG: alpha-E domain-containing protein [Caldilineaceae bacterium]
MGPESIDARAPVMLSRVADSLYWMSRYLERAKHTARVLDVHLDLMLDQPDAVAEQHRQFVLAGFQLPTEFGKAKDDYQLTQWLTFDAENANSIAGCIAMARENGRQVREQISSEMWAQINALYLFMQQVEMDAMWGGEPREFFQNVKEGIHLFIGLTDSTMTHGQGYHFIQAGRFIERAITTAMLLNAYYSPSEHLPATTTEEILVSDQLLWTALLRTCTAFEAYSKIYTAELEPRAILEFLLLNAEFPHSLAYAVQQVRQSLEGITDATHTSRVERAYRRAGRLYANLQYGQIDEIMEGGLHDYLTNIEESCVQIHEAIYQTYIAYPVAVD